MQAKKLTEQIEEAEIEEKADVAEHNRQRKTNQQELIEKDKHWQWEM